MYVVVHHLLKPICFLPVLSLSSLKVGDTSSSLCPERLKQLLTHIKYTLKFFE